MTARPIIFSAPMVRALLAGTKTQTRRVLKPQPTCDTPALVTRGVRFTVGDRLWVREKWARVPATAYRMSHGVEPTPYPHDTGMAAIYAASWERSAPTWKSPIHMPRWASRITLAVTDVRVERLQAISEADARAEGASYHSGGATGHSGWRHDWKDVHADARSSFRRLWNSINGPGAWEANPWVVALTFEVEVTTP